MDKFGMIQQMKYNALMLDIDGTLIPYDFDALPSESVKAAINKIKDEVTVCLVTGRTIDFVQPILESLSLRSGFAVVDNGASVVDISTRDILYERAIPLDEALFIADIFWQEDIPFYLKQEIFGFSYQKGPLSKNANIYKPYMFFTDTILSKGQVEIILSKVKDLKTIAIYKGHHKEKDLFSLNISHAEGTKAHGIRVIKEKMKLEKNEVIAVGDSYSDLPMFQESGLKVAMGNAVQELKEVADYIAKSVDNDGVSEIIEKFLLSEIQ